MPGIYGFVNKINIDAEKNSSVFYRLKKQLNFFDYQSYDFSNKSLCMGILSPHNGVINKEIQVGKSLFTLYLYGFIHSLDGHRYDYSRYLDFIVESVYQMKYQNIALLNGQYFVALHEQYEDVVYLISDRFAWESVYYIETSDRFYFFPDLIASKAIPEFQRELESETLIDHLYLTSPADDKTFIKGIKVFPSAGIFKISRTGSEKQKYWTINPRLKHTGEDIGTYAEQAYEKFYKAISYRLEIPGKKCLSLSGGLDSRTIAATIHKKNQSINCVTYGYPKSTDCRVALRLGQYLNFPTSHVDIDPDFVFSSLKSAFACTDGIVPAVQFFHLNAIKKYCLNSENRYTQHLSGFYGDVVLGGSKLKQSDLTNDTNIETIYHAIINRININFNKLELHQILTPRYHKQIITIDENLKNKIKIILGDLQETQFSTQITKFFFEIHARRYLSTNSHFRYFVYDSKPFMDYDFFDFCIDVPDALLIDHNLYNFYLKKYYPEVAGIRTAATGKPVGESSNAFRKIMEKTTYNLDYYTSRLSKGKLSFYNKYNYTQLTKWIFDNPGLMRYVNDILLSKKTIDRNIFNRKGIVKLFEDHAKGKWTSEKILNLFFLEMWLREFID